MIIDWRRPRAASAVTPRACAKVAPAIAPADRALLDVQELLSLSEPSVLLVVAK